MSCLVVALLLTALLGCAASCLNRSPFSTFASRHPKLEPTSMRKQVPLPPTVACSDEWVTNEGVSVYCSVVTISYNSKNICLNIRSLVQLRPFDTADNCVRNWLDEVRFESCAGSGNRKTATVRILNTTYGSFRFELVMLDEEVPDFDICNLDIQSFISFRPTDPKLAADNGATTGSGDIPPTTPTGSGDIPPTGSGGMPTNITRSWTSNWELFGEITAVSIVVVGVCTLIAFLCFCVYRRVKKGYVFSPKSGTKQVPLFNLEPKKTSGQPETKSECIIDLSRPNDD